MKETNGNPYRDLLLTVLLLGLVYWFRRWDALLIAAFSFIIIGLASGFVRHWNHVLWKSVTHLIQFIVQPILGGVIFFLVLTPIGLLSQVFKKQKKQSGSTFAETERKFDKIFFEKQW